MENQIKMEQYLTGYINRMRSHVNGFPATTAHEIASAFLAFRFRLYPNAIQECTRAISLIPGNGVNGALKKALSIVRANAEDLENAQFTADLTRAFSDEERPYIPVDLPPDRIEDPGTLQLDNALVLIYAVAVITSPDDEETLAEHRKFIVRLLMGYKKALGLD
jgi:hypothetical protein